MIEAVKFSRVNNLLVSTRGVGHSFPGISVAEGMVTGPSEMNSVRVDPITRTARAQGGTKWGAHDWESQTFGLVTSVGNNHDTGIGGFTLGGGMG